MSEIAIVKRLDLLRTELVKVLQKKLPKYKITCYEPNESERLLTKRNLPSVIIIDIDTVSNELELIGVYLRYGVKIIIWTSRFNEDLTSLFKLGLDGYFIYEMETEEIAFAINEVLQGRKYVHEQLSSVLLEDYLKFVTKKPKRPHNLLTDREWDILKLLVKGKQTGVIADELYISTKTVTNHVTSILRKLHVPDRTNAVILAIRKGWFMVS